MQARAAETLRVGLAVAHTQREGPEGPEGPLEACRVGLGGACYVCSRLATRERHQESRSRNRVVACAVGVG
eukprot:3435268-Prymnesium_polylepis.1